MVRPGIGKVSRLSSFKAAPWKEWLREQFGASYTNYSNQVRALLPYIF